MKEKGNKPKTKSRQQATELVNKIKAVILDGSGIRRRVAENLAEPVKFTADDGVVFDPAWQDDLIGPRKKCGTATKRKTKADALPKFPHVKVRLDDDRSVFALISRVLDAMRKAGVSKVERDAFFEEACAPLYDATVATAKRWLTVEP